jgi:predicted ABC-type sugar transport system permease subunit
MIGKDKRGEVVVEHTINWLEVLAWVAVIAVVVFILSRINFGAWDFVKKLFTFGRG